MDLEVAAVDAVVIGDDHVRRQLHVLVADGFQGAVELPDDEVKAAQDLILELLASSSWNRCRVSCTGKTS